MTFAILLAIAAQAGGGVAVDSVPQIGIATRYARCIVRQIGVAPAEDSARAAKVQDAVKGCRTFIESDYTQGRIMLGDRPVNKRWWGRMQSILDSVEADVTAAIVQPKQYKIIWELPGGGRVDAYNAPEPLKTIKLLTVPL
ncbi:hypothetical protein E5A73_05730 [Sphingomonas gei]|uniref:Uncharacterized protein n=1 Tax=Sphingomonas gei TaxID=1395960 RepID=A0A4S1XGX9_9SPHN|nr:hypothetical protein [Sphingomonas gei]TGX54940.1 hypothetical protein E5A73_05730 [Sphingomonas gei]